MNKKLASLMLALSFLIACFANTSTAHAEGWGFALQDGAHWGSSSITTSYPYLRLWIDFDVAVGYGGAGYSLDHACVKVQKLVGGSWVDVTSYDCNHWDGWSETISATKGVQYRVFVQHDGSAIPAKGRVGYAGSWTP